MDFGNYIVKSVKERLKFEEKYQKLKELNRLYDTAFGDNEGQAQVSIKDRKHQILNDLYSLGKQHEGLLYKSAMPSNIFTYKKQQKIDLEFKTLSNKIFDLKKEYVNLCLKEEAQTKFKKLLGNGDYDRTECLNYCKEVELRAVEQIFEENKTNPDFRYVIDNMFEYYDLIVGSLRQIGEKDADKTEIVAYAYTLAKEQAMGERREKQALKEKNAIKNLVACEVEETEEVASELL